MEKNIDTDEILSDEELDFFDLNDKVQNNIEAIWEDVILPYIENDNSILNLNENDIKKFISFFCSNSKYYKFISNNLY